MKKWYCLKRTQNNFDEIKSAAMASVIAKSTKDYYIVDENVISKYFTNLHNAIIGKPNKEDEVVDIELPDYAPFQILCDKLSRLLNINTKGFCQPYLDFIEGENEVDKQLSGMNNLVLFFYYLETDVPLLQHFEKTVNLLKGYSFICCGPIDIDNKLIKGALDFRGIIKIDEIIKNRQRIKVIVTSSPFVKEIGFLLHIPVILLYSDVFITYKNSRKEVIRAFIDYPAKLANTIVNIEKDIIFENTMPHCSSLFTKKFELPYNFDENILDYYKVNSSYINFLYLPPYKEDLKNSRSNTKQKGNSYMPQTREEYEFHTHLINKANLKFVVLWQDRKNVISKDMLDYYCKLGACGFTIANDINARIIKEYNPQLLVIASIIQRNCNNISNKDFSYYDYVVMYYPFNRSLDIVKKLSAIKDKIIIMPNCFCHTDCMGIQHWFSKDENFFDYIKLCPAYNDDSKSTYIRPEHLYLFENYVGGYKLQGREWKTDYIITLCESYFNRKSLDYLVPYDLDSILKKYMKDMSLDEYYNLKTPEIIDII